MFNNNNTHSNRKSNNHMKIDHKMIVGMALENEMCMLPRLQRLTRGCTHTPQLYDLVDMIQTEQKKMSMLQTQSP